MNLPRRLPRPDIEWCRRVSLDDLREGECLLAQLDFYQAIWTISAHTGIGHCWTTALRRDDGIFLVIRGSTDGMGGNTGVRVLNHLRASDPHWHAIPVRSPLREMVDGQSFVECVDLPDEPEPQEPEEEERFHDRWRMATISMWAVWGNMSKSPRRDKLKLAVFWGSDGISGWLEVE